MLFGGRTLFATEHEKVFSESGTKASTTSSAPTLEATGATISIFDDMLPATENRPQDRVLTRGKDFEIRARLYRKLSTTIGLS